MLTPASVRTNDETERKRVCWFDLKPDTFEPRKSAEDMEAEAWDRAFQDQRTAAQMKLSAERKRELYNELMYREHFRDKAMCSRHGISRATLWRLQCEALERPMQWQSTHMV